MFCNLKKVSNKEGIKYNVYLSERYKDKETNKVKSKDIFILGIPKDKIGYYFTLYQENVEEILKEKMKTNDISDYINLIKDKLNKEYEKVEDDIIYKKDVTGKEQDLIQKINLLEQEYKKMAYKKFELGMEINNLKRLKDIDKLDRKVEKITTENEILKHKLKKSEIENEQLKNKNKIIGAEVRNLTHTNRAFKNEIVGLKTDVAYWENLCKMYIRSYNNTNNSGMDKEPLTKEILKAGYKALALKNHPDRGGDMEKMQQLNDFRKKYIK